MAAKEEEIEYLYNKLIESMNNLSKDPKAKIMSEDAFVNAFIHLILAFCDTIRIPVDDFAKVLVEVGKYEDNIQVQESEKNTILSLPDLHKKSKVLN